MYICIYVYIYIYTYGNGKEHGSYLCLNHLVSFEGDAQSFGVLFRAAFCYLTIGLKLRVS